MPAESLTCIAQRGMNQERRVMVQTKLQLVWLRRYYIKYSTGWSQSVAHHAFFAILVREGVS